MVNMIIMVIVVIIIMVMIIMGVMVNSMVVIMILIIAVIKMLKIQIKSQMKRWLLDIRGSFNVIKCAVLALKRSEFPVYFKAMFYMSLSMVL